MVSGALTIGGLVGVVLAAGFVYWQVGRYAAPQVPRTLFDERRLFFAFTVGLFVGVPLALALVFYLLALGAGALIAAAIDLGLLVGGAELSQWVLLRTVYFGTGESGAFYALAYRAGISGIFALALVTESLSAPTLSAAAFGLAIVQSFAILSVMVASALLSVRGPARQARLGGSPASGALLGLFGFGLMGLGVLVDTPTAIVGALLAALGALWVYLRLREPVLAGLLPPRDPDEDEEEATPSRYGRLPR